MRAVGVGGGWGGWWGGGVCSQVVITAVGGGAAVALHAVTRNGITRCQRVNSDEHVADGQPADVKKAYHYETSSSTTDHNDISDVYVGRSRLL